MRGARPWGSPAGGGYGTSPARPGPGPARPAAASRPRPLEAPRSRYFAPHRLPWHFGGCRVSPLPWIGASRSRESPPPPPTLGLRSRGGRAVPARSAWGTLEPGVSPTECFGLVTGWQKPGLTLNWIKGSTEVIHSLQMPWFCWDRLLPAPVSISVFEWKSSIYFPD